MITVATQLASALAALALTSSQSGAAAQASPAASEQAAHAQGSCGSIGVGTGLRDGKGWVVSMLPGHHEFRVRGAGSVYVTAARKTTLDADAGRPYYIVTTGTKPDSVLEWKVPGNADWTPIAKYFLYPPQP